MKRKAPLPVPLRGRNGHPSPKETPAIRPALGQPGTVFPIVGIGASAGGLEAITSLLSHLPNDTGMAFVVIQHLDPTHPSMLGSALKRATRMVVAEAKNGAPIERNHVYVIPPTADLALLQGRLALFSRADTGTPHMPVDFFFRALAADRGSGAIGVVLSGTASDGTEGLKAIKVEGGITFAQEPRSAKFSGMPHSAIAAGVVDHSLPPEGIAQELIRLSRHPYLVTRDAELPVEWQTEDRLKKVIILLRNSTGVDFSDYRSATIVRRLSRRMALRMVASFDEYLKALVENPDEAKALCQDILVHVTGFFRDPQAFESLKEHVFPEILKHKREGPVRIWVPGCATGEEPYSLAICLLEFLKDSPATIPIQILGSDLSENAVAKARAGFYPESACHHLSQDRLTRFFSPAEGGGYRINKGVRDLCVFVRHDLTRDPPFSKLDLISCRNVLIYFGPALQERVFPLFHYSLNLPGFLLLGHAEAMTRFNNLFLPVDSEQKIFLRSAMPSRLPFAFTMGAQTIREPERDGSSFETHPSAADIQKQADYLLLTRYAPAGVLINERMEVLQFRGRTGPYLEAAPGQPQLNILKMAREGLLSELRLALARAKREMGTVRKKSVHLNENGQTRSINIEVIPVAGIPESKERFFLVLFEEAQPRSSPELRETRQPKSSAVARRKRGRSAEGRPAIQLAEELAAAKEHIQMLVEEHQRTSDLLTTANEELLSGNEELQSANEELQTAQEELQSTNEELTTLNDELQTRNQEANHLNNDLVNLIASVNIPILIVDGDRRVRRFTPMARTIMNLIPSDAGRPVDDIKPNLHAPDLHQWISEVLDTLVTKEVEVQDLSGHWYRIQIRPYKTTDNKIDGCVVSLVDVDELKRAAEIAEKARAEGAAARLEAENANHNKDIFLATLSHELRTPLSVMLLQAQLLRRGTLDDNRTKRAVEAVEKAALLQMRLIEDLLDVSRIIVGKLSLGSEEVDLASVIRAAVEELRGDADAKSLRMEIALDESVGAISGDPTRLKQVLWNLLANAIKFSPDNTRVVVSLDRVGDHARIKVRDEGRGIRPEFIHRIFEPFSQQDSSTTRKYGGLGLGLAIVRRIVELHAGTVQIESPGEGKGTTVSVNLPRTLSLPEPARGASVSQATVPATVRDGHDTPPQLGGIRIMLVDDDTAGRETIAEVLEQYGARVRGAASAEEAIQSIDGFRPEVLLCDISMPGEDGYSLLRKVRELGPEHGGQIPAAALTVHASEEDRTHALFAGFQMHIAKPIDAERLVAAVEKLAGRPSQKR